MTALTKMMKKDRSPNRVAPKVAVVVTGRIMRILQGEAAKGTPWISQDDLTERLRHGCIRTHSNFYAVKWLCEVRGWVEKALRKSPDGVSRMYVRASAVALGFPVTDYSHAREKEMDRIMMFMNSPLRLHRNNFTKLEVANGCKRTNTSSKIFRASFKELERRGAIHEVLSPSGRHSGVFTRGP